MSGFLDAVDSLYSGYIEAELGYNCQVYNDDVPYECYIQGSGPITALHYGDDIEYICYISGSIIEPDINFVGNPRIGIKPMYVTFTDTTTYPVGYSGVWRSWNFGDPYGNDNILQGSGLYKTVNHIYPINGVYNVSLQVKMCKI